MADKESPQQKPMGPDWFVRGALTRVGDIFDRFLGRNWEPSSSLATSELIERIKKVLDGEARDVPGKGRVVPHHLELRVEWNKFSTDREDVLANLENELLAATVDHINDSLYYTYAPVEIAIKPDYFIEGVKLQAGFDRFEDEPAELNVTVPAIDVKEAVAEVLRKAPTAFRVGARFKLNGVEKEKEVALSSGQSMSVGRIASNEFVFDDSSVSKTHASLAVDDTGQLSIADTGSTNGTFVNEERIAYGKAIAISEKDTVKFGDVDVRFAVQRTEPGIATEKMDDPHKANTVEVDGFTFTSRSSIEPEVPKPDKTEN